MCPYAGVSSDQWVSSLTVEEFGDIFGFGNEIGDEIG